MARQPKPALPEPVDRNYRPFVVDNQGWWLILSDVHLPYHDKQTVELAIAEARHRRAAGVILNGDILDYHEISRHDKDPSAPRYVEELRIGKEFFRYLRHRLPKARIIYKLGNHEERLDTYIVRQAPAFFGIEAITTPALLGLAAFGVEHVADKRVISFGHLNILHGHEHGNGSSSPVNPARGLFLRAKSSAVCGHYHQISEHLEPTIRGKQQGAWSIGCACNLSPQWLPLNRWANGYAMVELHKGGDFQMNNRRVLDGKVL